MMTQKEHRLLLWGDSVSFLCCAVSCACPRAPWMVVRESQPLYLYKPFLQLDSPAKKKNLNLLVNALRAKAFSFGKFGE